MTPLKKIIFFLFLFVPAVLASCDEDNDPAATPDGLVADAGSDYSLAVDETIQLDGSASRADNNQFFSYLWSIRSKPAGSVAAISNAKIVNPIFSANMAGDYVIELQIIQAKQVAKDEMTIHVTGRSAANPIVLAESISSDTELANLFDDPSKVDYVVINSVEVRANLVIAPGVVIAFEQDKGLEIISGSVEAKGTISDPITFRGTQPGAGFWKGLLFHTNGSNVLENVSVIDAGSSSFTDIQNPASIALAGTEYSGAALRLVNSTISGSGGYGLFVQGSSALNAFAGNTFSSNDLAAAFIPVSQLNKLEGNNVANGNGFNGVETGGMLHGSVANWQRDLGGIFRVTTDLLIDAGLHIEPGVALIMDEGVNITVSASGFLNATGTPENRIMFKSAADNKYWDGIAFISANANNRMENCIIANAGQNGLADADQRGNIVVGANASLTIKNSIIKNGSGYGIVTKDMANLNNDVFTANVFENLLQGAIYPAPVSVPDKPSLTGTWVDEWTFLAGKNTIDENLYNRQTGEWFGGVPDPYSGDNAGFGLTIGADSKFVWTTVQIFPVPDCPSHTADYMTGSVVPSQTDWLTFDLDYWRSMFVSSCDPTMNVDTGVSPQLVELRYEIKEMYDAFTGERFWRLTFFRPDESTYSFYRK